MNVAPQTLIDGRYEVAERIGTGGMADVWLAHDRELDRRVALKLLHRQYAEDEAFVERFRREASSAAGLSHPNVVAVFDRGEWEGRPYIAMEYVEGYTLKDLVRAEAPMPPLQAIDLTLGMLEAARFAHKHGIIHRDLKPQNVLIDEDGRVRVTDFGIARAGASDMTETGLIMGTVEYISPEQAQGHTVSAASDLYSVGVVLYELLTSHVPFDANSPVTIALKHVSEPPRPPGEENDQVSPELDGIVMHALEKFPEDRFTEADEFIAALVAERERIESGAPSSGAALIAPVAAPIPLEDLDEEERRRRRRKMAWIAAGVILLLAAIAVAAVLLWPSTDQKRVPNVVGQPADGAAARLSNEGFKVDVQRLPSQTVPEGDVARTDPEPGNEVDSGSTVTLFVSEGPKQAPVPDVSGRKRAAAQEDLENAGFKVRVEEEFSTTVDSGTVIRSSPPGGVRADAGSTVTIVVSDGVRQVEVPDVVGDTEDAAIAALRAQGFQASTSTETSDDPTGTVTRQDPGGGETIDEGSTVEIVIAEAEDKVSVPSVTGQSQSTAATAISGAGLTVNFKSRTVTDPDQDGVVLSQSPAGGSEVDSGSRVTLTVGRYNPPDTDDGGGGSGGGSGGSGGATPPPPATGPTN